jgi:hypothetical protein
MSKSSGDWYDEAKKSGAVYKVLRYLKDHPSEGLACVGNDNAAKQLFKAQGGIAVPSDGRARVIFFAPGERATTVGASVIIELPPASLVDPGDKELSQFILGDYDWWPPRGTVLS